LIRTNYPEIRPGEGNMFYLGDLAVHLREKSP
jgi:hypothetical protein